MPRDESMRRVPPWLIAAAVLLLAARFGAAAYEKRHPPQLADLVHWTTPTDAEQILSMEQRPTLYDFTADWCEPCAQLRQEVFGDVEGAEQTNRFLAVRVLQDDATKNAPYMLRLQDRFSVDSLPTLIITGPKLPNALVLRGYVGAEKTRKFLKDGFLKATMGPNFESGF